VCGEAWLQEGRVFFNQFDISEVFPFGGKCLDCAAECKKACDDCTTVSCVRDPDETCTITGECTSGASSACQGSQLVSFDRCGQAEPSPTACATECVQMNDRAAMCCEPTSDRVCGANDNNVHAVDSCGREGAVVLDCVDPNGACVDDNAPACGCQGGWQGAQCDTCGANWDTTKNCSTCVGNYDPDQSCTECKGHWAAASGCTTCETNWDVDEDCERCLSGWTGADCMTPDVFTDPTTGLMWEKRPPDLERDLGGARAYCTNLANAFDDWRLPRIDELRTLVRACPAIATGGACGITNACEAAMCSTTNCSGSCNEGSGPGGEDGCFWPADIGGYCIRYWSASAAASFPGSRWTLSFISGDIAPGTNTQEFWYRCVRGP